MANATKAPTGISISRNGGVYTVSWKIGDKNYKKGQQFQYKINSGNWVSLSIGTGTTAKAISINLSNYFPSKNSYFSTLSVRIRGKKGKHSWSAWANKTYTNYVPNVPNLSASLDEQQTNKSTFTWSEVTASTDGRPFYHVRWETILVEESDITDGSKLTWDSSQLGWETDAGSSASSKTITEDTSLLADASYTRWFRVCGRGARGSSSWRYANHVYARPYQAQIEEANVTNTDAEGMTCYVRWTADQKPSHPIDYTIVQYLITAPNSNLACPSGAQWTDANISADTANSDAARFSIDDVLGKDECLFVRVNTVHDSNITYSEPYLASVGDLKDPTDLSYTPNNTAHTLTSVSVDNNSDVPDSFIVIVYKAGSDPENEIPVGIIAHGASQPLVTPVVCPDWSGESAFTIGAYAAVGTYSANTGLGYTVNVKMRSANTIWVGGAVPVAPENVNAVQSAIHGTATVTWDWTWTNATYAQLSWTDHADAWESTDEPEIYTINQARATRWNISGLELGKKWYIAVRLVNGNPEDETAIFGPWSKLTDITLSSVPNVPSIKLSSNVITEGEEITVSWDFISNDGTGQISAEICEVIDGKHGKYFLSEDTSISIEEDGVTVPNGKEYYTESGGEYTLVPDSSKYALTTDTAIVSSKTYYARTGSGTVQSPYVFTVVASPVIADIGTYYEVSADPKTSGWYEYQAYIAHTTIEKEVIINTALLGWTEGETHNLAVRVTSESKRTTDWSNPVSVIVAEALECEITSTTLEEVEITVDGETRTILALTELPMTIELDGITNKVTTTVSIERAANYTMDRPDETSFEGFESEIIYLITQNTDDDIVIDQADLLGYLDDKAQYRIIAAFKDTYGQSISESIEFEVHWTHQALVPDAEVEIDDENLIAVLTPVAPTYNEIITPNVSDIGTYYEYINGEYVLTQDVEIDDDKTYYVAVTVAQTDTCDIYRLSADKPELIVQNAAFGTDYVDPYPAIGQFGGHRFVFKTANGDYITKDNIIAWTDTNEDDGDILDIDKTIIDFNGNQLFLYYNVDVGHEWSKDFQETKYLGGSVQGDWNAGVSRSGSISATMLTLTDAEQIRLMKRLAEYTGPCHVRTKDGSSFTADVQVSEDRDHSDYDAIATFSMTITRIGAETLDGLTYAQWSQGES